MARLQNIMDSLEPAVMGKVEEIIAKHEASLEADAGARKSPSHLCDMTLAQLEYMDKIRAKYNEQRRGLIGLHDCGARNAANSGVFGGFLSGFRL